MVTICDGQELGLDRWLRFDVGGEGRRLGAAGDGWAWLEEAAWELGVEPNDKVDDVCMIYRKADL